MKVRALRGVCVGVNRHLRPGDVDEVDASTVTFLKSIGAVEEVIAPSAPPVTATAAVTRDDEQVVLDEAAATSRANHEPLAKAGKKEK